MEVFPFRAPRWIAAGLGTLLLAAVVGLAPARAATAALDVGDQAIVNVFVRGAGNRVEIRTWDRPSVEVEGDEQPTVERRSAPFGVPGGQPLSQTVGPANFRQPDGTRVVVPPEEFPFNGMRPGVHDVVRVQAGPNAHLVVNVPANVGLLRAVVGNGTTEIDGYRGANLFVLQGGGRVRVVNTTTTAFVQLAGGLFQGVDDTFDRLRARANGANLVFENCRSKEIETSTIRGNVVYDGGSFQPGLARFDSQSGNIAIGAAGAAQLTGRSEDGRVFTSFEQRGISIQQQAANAATATVGGGGALVNALSGHGNVYLYDGSLRNRRSVPPAFQGLHQALTRRIPPARQRTKARTSGASRRRA